MHQGPRQGTDRPGPLGVEIVGGAEGEHARPVAETGRGRFAAVVRTGRGDDRQAEGRVPAGLVPGEHERLKDDVADGQRLAVRDAKGADGEVLVDQRDEDVVEQVGAEDLDLGDVNETLHRGEQLQVEIDGQFVAVVVGQGGGIVPGIVHAVVHPLGRSGGREHAFRAEGIMRAEGGSLAGGGSCQKREGQPAAGHRACPLSTCVHVVCSCAVVGSAAAD